MWIFSVYLTLHNPLTGVGPNIFPRIFLSKLSTILKHFWERVHVSFLLYKTMLLMRVLYSITRNLQLVSRNFIRSISFWIRHRISCSS
jgi:hypothetical protein